MRLLWAQNEIYRYKNVSNSSKPCAYRSFSFNNVTPITVHSMSIYTMVLSFPHPLMAVASFRRWPEKAWVRPDAVLIQLRHVKSPHLRKGGYLVILPIPHQLGTPGWPLTPFIISLGMVPPESWTWTMRDSSCLPCPWNVPSAYSPHSGSCSKDTDLRE